MKKIVVTSDVHGKRHELEKVLSTHYDADAYIDCGDSEMHPDIMKPFVSVKGNNDYDFDYPNYRIIKHNGVVFLVIHSHQIMMFKRDDALVKKAKSVKADVVLFGHYHIFYDKVVDGIHLISPGALSYNKDQTPACYALLSINNNQVQVTRKNISK